MDASGQNRLQVRIQGLLKKIKPEKLRTQVAGWQKLIATASAKINTELYTRGFPKGAGDKLTSGDAEGPSKVGTSATETAASTSSSDLSSESAPSAPASELTSSATSPEERLSETPGSELVESNDNSSSDTCDTCVLVVPSSQATSDKAGTDNKSVVGRMESEVRGASGDLNLLSPVAADASPLRNRSPVTVQQWVDSLPLDDIERRDEEMPAESEAVVDAEVENLTLGAEAAALCRPCPSVQITGCGPCAGGASDAGSHCSSMESLLEARKPDPEEILMELGFGGAEEPDTASRIPCRFLQPSQLKGVAINDFLRHQQHLVDTFQSGFSGYRGLTGPSHTMPSVIVGKIMDRLREAEVGRGGGGAAAATGLKPPPTTSSIAGSNGSATPRFARLAHNVLNKLRCVRESVLSPDNRRWLESQGDKSPEPGTRRIIFGQRSFTFAQDGDLVETTSPNHRSRANSPILLSSPITDERKELAATPSRKSLGDKEQLEIEYKTVCLLAAQLNDSELPINIGSEENFFNLSVDERRCLEVGLIESALATYQKRLKELDVRTHLKDLLGGQLNKVTDVLDTSSCPSLLTVVRQLTTLLRHQDSLREELKMHESDDVDLEDDVSS